MSALPTASGSEAAAATAPAVLAVERVRRVFNPGTVDEVVALRDLSLTIPEGQFVALLGSNGAGKSTLLNTVAGVIVPDAGRVLLDGRDITRLREHERAHWIGRVFQNPTDGTAGSLSVEQNLALALMRGGRHGLAQGVSRARREAMLAALPELGLGLERRLTAKVGLLSGGQRQALALLMATIVRPRLLLLDEHTASLDPNAAEQIGQLTARLVREHGLTTLMVTHNLHQALRLADRILLMHQGELVLDFSGEALRDLTVERLIAEFARVRRQALADDTLLLAEP